MRMRRQGSLKYDLIEAGIEMGRSSPHDWFSANCDRLMNYTQQLFNNVHKLYLSIYTDVEQPIAGAVTFMSRRPAV